MTTVGVLGLGKLGLPLALVLAEATDRVLAWDVSADVREAVRTGKCLIDEPGVDALMRDYPIEVAPPGLIAELADVVFVIVPTPSNDNGSFDSSHVETAIRLIAEHKSRPEGPIIVVVSTVSPGTCRDFAGIIAPKKMPLVYAPTMIALGTVVHDLRCADTQYIGFGEGDDNATAAVEVANIFLTVAPDAKRHFMSWESAELAKIANNAYATLKITFANEVAQLCDMLGADCEDVIPALGDRPHIGRKLLTPGAGYGGPCFPRDTHAYAHAGSAYGAVIHRMNVQHLSYVATTAAGMFSKGERPKTYAVLGRQYKEGTNYRIESFGDDVARQLEGYGLTEAPARSAETIIIAMPLRGMNLCDKINPNARVLDVWRTHTYLQQCQGVEYVALGKPRRKDA